MSATSGITQNEAGQYANVTRTEVTTGERSSVCDGNANWTGRVRGPDVVDPYQMSQARRQHPGWLMIRSEQPDRDA